MWHQGTLEDLKTGPRLPFLWLCCSGKMGSLEHPLETRQKVMVSVILFPAWTGWILDSFSVLLLYLLRSEELLRFEHANKPQRHLRNMNSGSSDVGWAWRGSAFLVLKHFLSIRTCIITSILCVIHFGII